MMLPSLQKYLAQDMKDIASMMKISESEVCQSLEQNAAMWADNMDYRKRVPDGAQLLLMK
jgi:DNA-directed RNA polymerase specialized sigma subunit